MAKGYTDLDRVTALLGVALTAAQEEAFYEVLDAVEATIDQITGQAWLGGAITGELVRPIGYHVYLTNAPVATIESITGRRFGETSTKTLVANNDYFVVSLPRGQLYLPAGEHWDYLLANYTPTQAVPADIAYAAGRMAIHRMAGAFSGSLASGQSGSIRSLSIGGEVSVTYGGSSGSVVATQAAQHDVPEDVMGILLTYRSVVLA